MTCGSALGNQCVNDLLEQAQGLLNGQGQAVVCADLQAQMQASPPSSCLGVAMVTWGSVVAKGESLLSSPFATKYLWKVPC